MPVHFCRNLDHEPSLRQTEIIYVYSDIKHVRSDSLVRGARTSETLPRISQRLTRKHQVFLIERRTSSIQYPLGETLLDGKVMQNHEIKITNNFSTNC